MNLLEPLMKLVGLAEKTDKAVESITQKLSTADARIIALEAENTQLKADLATAKQSMSTMEADHKAALEAKEKEVAARVEKLATEKSIEICASQGIPPIKTEAKTGGGDTSAREQYLALLSANKSMEAARFYAENRNKILS